MFFYQIFREVSNVLRTAKRPKILKHGLTLPNNLFKIPNRLLVQNNQLKWIIESPSNLAILHWHKHILSELFWRSTNMSNESAFQIHKKSTMTKIKQLLNKYFPTNSRTCNKNVKIRQICLRMAFRRFFKKIEWTKTRLLFLKIV